MGWRNRIGIGLLVLGLLAGCQSHEFGVLEEIEIRDQCGLGSCISVTITGDGTRGGEAHCDIVAYDSGGRVSWMEVRLGPIELSTGETRKWYLELPSPPATTEFSGWGVHCDPLPGE